MFTGIVEELGSIRSLSISGNSGRICINADKVLQNTNIGDSIAVNGICLTVVTMTPDSFTADVMAETIRRSSLKGCKPHDKVNLERAMAADGRFGGHIVAGHIDGTGIVSSVVKEENAIWYTITASPDILHYVVEKGSIAIDGISLTVAYVDDSCFKVSVIPHTCEMTVLPYRRKGDTVNLETDIVGKYIEKLLKPAESSNAPASRLTMDMLRENGF